MHGGDDRNEAIDAVRPTLKVPASMPSEAAGLRARGPHQSQGLSPCPQPYHGQEPVTASSSYVKSRARPAARKQPAICTPPRPLAQPQSRLPRPPVSPSSAELPPEELAPPMRGTGVRPSRARPSEAPALAPTRPGRNPSSPNQPVSTGSWTGPGDDRVRDVASSRCGPCPAFRYRRVRRTPRVIRSTDHAETSTLVCRRSLSPPL
jgi:hypothetical protein